MFVIGENMGKLFKKLQSKHKRGFTLFEVLVVVIILGTLAVIAVPTYNKVIRKSRVSDGLHVLDMLVNAQDKYYIEHGYYAENITSLGAPFKEIRTADPSHPFVDIVTTNFTYSKNFRKNCIEARSNVGGTYTLIKNFQKRDKVVCTGADCANVEDYVDAVGEEAYGDLCPDENQCTKDQQWCANNQPGTHFFWLTCSCACNHNDYLACIQSGGTFRQSDCSCHEPEPCKPEENYSGYGADCNYTGAIPEYGNGNQSNVLGNIIKETKGGTRGTKGSSTPIEPPGSQTRVCGIYYDTHICNEETGEWQDTHECVYKANYCSSLGAGYVLNTTTCECVRQCDQSVPHTVEIICGVPVHDIEICDPCSQNQVVVPGMPNTRGNTKGGAKGGSGSGNGQAYAEEHCCGYRNTGGDRVECNYQTGAWECIKNDNPCIQVESSEIDQPCDGPGTPGSQCGIQKYAGCEFNEGFMGVHVVTACTENIAAGKECFDGQTSTQGCPEGQQKECVNCQWNDCHESMCTDPQPPDEETSCGRYPYVCIKVDDVWKWVKGDFVPNAGNECDTGMTDPDGCPEGQFKVCDENCMWSDCITAGCDESTKPTGYAYQMCHTKNGVTDPDLYCGTQRTNKYVCIDDEWKPDFSESTECYGGSPGYPAYDYPVSSMPCNLPGWQSGCGIKYPYAECIMLNSSNYYSWNYPPGPIQYTCKKKPGSTCGWPGLSGNLGNGKFCFDYGSACKVSKCQKNGTVYSLYNAHHNKCYETKYDRQAVATLIRSNTTNLPSPNGHSDTGTVVRWESCGNEGYHNGHCTKECNYNHGMVTTNYTYTNGQEYCESSQASSVEVIDDGTTYSTTMWCEGTGTGEWTWKKYAEVYNTIYCKEVLPVVTGL